MSGEDEQQEQTIAEDLVVTKYKMGGDIANRECGLGPEGEAEGERQGRRRWAGPSDRRGAVVSRGVGC